MESLIPIINKLQYVFRTTNTPPLSLPQLVVVGSQSAGKSSVLEHIVGNDFLPRGNGIVTRRPLILQLVHIHHNNSSSSTDEHLPHYDQHSNDDYLYPSLASTSSSVSTSSHPTQHTHTPSTTNATHATTPSLSKQNSLNTNTSKSGSNANQQATSPRPMIPPRKDRSSATSTLSSTQQLFIQQLNDLSMNAADSNSNSSQQRVEYGEFSHQPGKRYTDFNAIRDEIIADTERIAGTNKGISDQPIILTIYSAHVLTLTLVDLPGLTKVAIGDQPSDIELQIRNLILQYITSPNSIIVAVTPANNDIANSDALKFAKEVDPMGERTIGVITKLDLMDRGTDALEILTGNVIALQHGYVGVINRSQHDINTNKRIAEAKKQERLFFQNHPIYRSIASRLGSDYLCKKLSYILMQHIRRTLPDMKTRLVALIGETQQELDSYGSSGDLDADGLARILLSLISSFYRNYCDALDGKLTELTNHHLYGGARLKWLFNDVLRIQIEMCNPFDTLSDSDIRIAMLNAAGAKPALFISEIAFELLIKKQIERLLAASLEVVDLVYQELHRVSQQCEALLPSLQRFPQLKQGIHSCINMLLQQRIEPTKQMITNLIHAELAYINTSHPAFIGGSKAVAILLERYQAAQLQLQQQQSSALLDNSSMHKSNVHRDHAAGYALANGVTSEKQSHPLSHSLHGKILPTEQRANGAAASTSGLFSYFMRSPLNNSATSVADTASVASNPLPPHNTTHPHLINPPPMSLDTNSIHTTSNPHYKRRSGGNRRRSISTIDHANGTLDHHQSTSAPSSTSASNVHVGAISLTEREISEIEVIKLLIRSYFDIVKTTVADLTPKFIMLGMVNHSRQHLQTDLVKKLYKPDQLQDLLSEAPEIKSKRLNCVELLSMLHKALDIVNEASDLYKVQYELL